MGFFADNKYVLIFYGIIILLLFIYRKRFEVQGKIIALYRTKIGLKAMTNIANKHKELIKLLGYTGIGIGVVGLVFIFVVLIQNMWQLFTHPEAQSGVSLVIPGVHIPGAIITPPLIIGWIALFIVIVVHEFSHGVVAKAHDIKIKSSGLAFFGPLMGAFVEPEEKTLQKRQDVTQYSVYAAGPFSNILLAFIAIIIGSWIILPLLGLMTAPIGFSIGTVQEEFPAQIAGLEEGTIISGLNGINTPDYMTFSEQMNFIKANETIILNTDKGDISIITTTNPKDLSSPRGYIGVSGFQNEIRLKEETTLNTVLLNILAWFKELFIWVYILSLGIGLANLLPLGPVDGGRIALVALTNIKGKEKGMIWWKKLSVFTLFILLLNILWPLFKWIGTNIMIGLAALF
ncbi:MAG: site-2 protease family protein [Nanoarchaeota archaeon]|nr:site-2 protease family protein [Nanoarchaeota archaeon]